MIVVYLAGLGAIVAGVVMLSVPAALIVGGALTVITASAAERGRT